MSSKQQLSLEVRLKALDQATRPLQMVGRAGQQMAKQLSIAQNQAKSLSRALADGSADRAVQAQPGTGRRAYRQDSQGQRQLSAIDGTTRQPRERRRKDGRGWRSHGSRCHGPDQGLRGSRGRRYAACRIDDEVPADRYRRTSRRPTNLPCAWATGYQVPRLTSRT